MPCLQASPMTLGVTTPNLVDVGRLSVVEAALPSVNAMSYSRRFAPVPMENHSERSRNLEARWISEMAKKAGCRP